MSTPDDTTHQEDRDDIRQRIADLSPHGRRVILALLRAFTDRHKGKMNATDAAAFQAAIDDQHDNLAALEQWLQAHGYIDAIEIEAEHA